MVGQIVAFGDLVVYLDNSEDSKGKSDLKSSEINYGLKR